MTYESGKNTADGVTVIAILGFKLNLDGSPKGQLVSRCTLGAEVAKSVPNPLVVASGGDPLRIGVTEAQVMSKILTEHGVLEDRIVRDDQSKDTAENAYYTFKLVQDRCAPDQSASIVLITSKYHMPRASWLFRAIAKAMGVSWLSAKNTGFSKKFF